MKEEIYMVADSLGVFHPETIEVPDWTVSRFFAEGGIWGMSLITVFLIALFLAAWKAPRWVREIGLGALVVSIFLTLMGLFQILGTVELIGNISFPVISGGLRVTLISTFYGLIIYLVSLVIRLIRKPRL